MLRALLIAIVLLVLILALQQWFWRGAESQELPPLRIVCQGDEEKVKCPSDCMIGEDNVAHCRCEDVYRRSVDGEMRFFRTQCD